jgi:hypothetical protein
MDNDINLIKKFYDDLGKTVQPAHIQLTGREQLELFSIVVKAIAKDQDSAMRIMGSLGLVLRQVGSDPALGADVFIEGINDALKMNNPDATPMPRYLKPMLTNILQSMVQMDAAPYLPKQ